MASILPACLEISVYSELNSTSPFFGTRSMKSFRDNRQRAFPEKGHNTYT